MRLLEDLRTGILYKNLKPHVRSIHAYFPSVVILPGGEMIAAYTLGEAFEATNLHTCLARSSDGGETWEAEGRMFPERQDRLTSEIGKLAVTPDAGLIANLLRHDRTDHCEEGLANPETLGMAPTELLISRSADLGRTWSPPVRVQTLVEGPEFELSSSIVMLRDGRWLWPAATWRDWAGNPATGNRVVALVSDDQGRTWPRHLEVMDGTSDHLMFWESKIVELADDRLLALAWCYEEEAQRDCPNQFVVSSDGGASWSPPKSTGLSGQTLTPLVLRGGRVLIVYRRTDEPGLWANLSRLVGDEWVNDQSEPLWGYASEEGITRTGTTMAETFSQLKFGAPCAAELPDGAVFVAFWCYEQGISIIRWFKFWIG